MVDRLRLAAGDRVLAIETEGGILLTPYDPTTDRTPPAHHGAGECPEALL
jgi:hypothetical protein